MQSEISESRANKTNETKRARPLALLISVIRDQGGTNEVQHKIAFQRLLDENGYEDFRDAVVDEWIRIKYSTAFAAAHPPSVEELKHRAAANKAKQAAERKEIDKAKIRITTALSLIMPNKKTLARCTGAECILFGSWYVKIGERIGPTQLVGRVLTNQDLAALMDVK